MPKSIHNCSKESIQVYLLALDESKPEEQEIATLIRNKKDVPTPLAQKLMENMNLMEQDLKDDPDAYTCTPDEFDSAWFELTKFFI